MGWSVCGRMLVHLWVDACLWVRVCVFACLARVWSCVYGACVCMCASVCGGEFVRVFACVCVWVRVWWVFVCVIVGRVCVGA